MIRINPDHVTPARELAAKINTAAKNASELLRAHSNEVSDAEKRLAEARVDRAGITSAERALNDLEKDLESLEAAKTTLREAEADTEQLEAKRSELLAVDASARVRETAALQKSFGHSVRSWWQLRRRRTKAAVLVGVLVVVLGAAGALSAPQSDPSTNSAAAQEHNVATEAVDEASPPPAPKHVELSIIRPKANSVTVAVPTFSIRGFATPGSEVRINRAPLSLYRNRFTKTARLRLGINRFAVVAKKPGFSGRSQTITVVRQKPLVSLAVNEPTRTSITVRVPSITVQGRANARLHSGTERNASDKDRKPI